MLKKHQVQAALALIGEASNSQLYDFREAVEHELDLSEACIADGEEVRR